ncbi:SBBP repeat-containing protein [Flagellimonas lutimaris]|nr:SBBP repeat-containing protein [Allomuricauda lutimaris]
MKKLLIIGIVLLASSKNNLLGQNLSSSMTYSTNYGDNGTDDADVVTVDLGGNTYLGCHSNSADLPGATQYRYSLAGDMDAFVVKLNKKDNDIGYITHLGGENWDAVQGIITDSIRNIYAVGTTYSSDFPIHKSGFQSTFGGKSDAFVVKLDPQGNVVWSTFLGGSEDEDGRDIAMDKHGNIHIVGRTASTDFPTTNEALQSKSGGKIDAFVTTFDSNGKILASTYLGGSGDDIGFSIALDRMDQLYIAGTTNSQNFPLKNAIQTEIMGEDDAFIAVIDQPKSVINFASYLGGGRSERLYGIEVDSAGDVFIMGFTNSSDYPTTKKAFQLDFRGIRDVFVTRLDIHNQKLIYSTYLGGNGDDRPKNFLIDKKGNACIIGFTDSNVFPWTEKRTTYSGGEGDAFISIIDPSGSTLRFTNLIGGKGDDFFEGLAAGPDGSLTMSGGTDSVDFPLIDPIQDSNKGGRFDIIVTRISLDKIKF